VRGRVDNVPLAQNDTPEEKADHEEIRLLFYLVTLKGRSPEIALQTKGAPRKSLVVASRESCSKRNSEPAAGFRNSQPGTGDVSAGQVRYKRADPKPVLSR
jgi:hypothetical protein